MRGRNEQQEILARVAAVQKREAVLLDLKNAVSSMVRGQVESKRKGALCELVARLFTPNQDFGMNDLEALDAAYSPALPAPIQAILKAWQDGVLAANVKSDEVQSFRQVLDVSAQQKAALEGAVKDFLCNKMLAQKGGGYSGLQVWIKYMLLEIEGQKTNLWAYLQTLNTDVPTLSDEDLETEILKAYSAMAIQYLKSRTETLCNNFKEDKDIAQDANFIAQAFNFLAKGVDLAIRDEAIKDILVAINPGDPENMHANQEYQPINRACVNLSSPNAIAEYKALKALKEQIRVALNILENAKENSKSMGLNLGFVSLSRVVPVMALLEAAITKSNLGDTQNLLALAEQKMQKSFDMRQTFMSKNQSTLSYKSALLALRGETETNEANDQQKRSFLG